MSAQVGAGSPVLTLDAALAAARRTSPDLRGAREAVAAAAARERQAGAIPSPTLAYAREQTSRDGQSNAQDIVQLEQPLELGGQRGVRREAAGFRRAAAEARLASAQSLLDLDVARAFVLAIAAERLVQLTEQSMAAFTEAERVSDVRLAAGDISGYAARRLRLEAARYAAQRAEASLAGRTARTALVSLMGLPSAAADSLVLPAAPVVELTAGELVADAMGLSLDSLVALAERRRPELRAAIADAAALAADAQLAARARIPVPTLSAGYKYERVAGGTTTASLPTSGFKGFIAGVSLPLPLFDRRADAVAAAEADARRVTAESDVVRRRLAREVSDAVSALRAAEEQRATLAPYVGEGSRIALAAVQTGYAEGEISLVEWLDAVRAFKEAESAYATLEADVAVRRAVLARAVGAPLLTDSSAGDADAAGASLRKD